MPTRFSNEKSGAGLIDFAAKREQRIYTSGSGDQRSEFERDRDRVLYSSAFHRLAGITQIARAGEESVFHTRQQHTIKVAQVGRRLAQWCIRKQSDLAAKALINDEVVEAACLIHDLGHPPFGHIGEEALNELVTKHEKDGFEGNAQSFRIITKLAVRKEFDPGMNLTRAVLAASLKYPWLRSSQAGSKKHKKWSAYNSEKTEFQFAQELMDGENPSVEARLMDWADDIAYSVHDLEDFHRCNAVPWNYIFSVEGKNKLLEKMADSGNAKDIEQCFDSLKNLISSSFDEILKETYEGTRRQRWVLRALTSKLIGLYIDAVTLNSKKSEVDVVVDPRARCQVDILKQITRDYIISVPSLAAQQLGYRKIISDLYNIFEEGSEKEMPPFTPMRLRYLWDLADGRTPRFAADCVASLSEAEAVAMHARLTGYVSGSVLNPIVR